MGRGTGALFAAACWLEDTARPLLPPLATLIGYAAAITRPVHLLGDPDTFWHIATGRWMLRHAAVPHADPFSASLPGAPWVDHEWLSEVLLALAWRGGGWPGVAALAGAALALALGLLAAFLRRDLPAYAALALTLAAVATLTPDLYARPHVLALPALVLWTGSLLTRRAGEHGPDWRLVPLMCLWANLHGSFALGLLLIPPLGLEAWRAAAPERRARTAARWAAFGLLAVAAAWLTPNGTTGLLHPFMMMRMPVMAEFVEEWASPDFHRFQPLEAWLLLALLLALTRGVRLPPIRVALLLLLLHAAFVSRRNAYLLGFLAPLLIAGPLGRPTRRVERRSLSLPAWGTVILAGAALSALLLSAAAPDPWNTPREALAAVPGPVRETPVLNEYDFGGYLIFRGLRPFVDGRADMYGDDFLREYQLALRPDLHRLVRLLRRHDIGWTLLRADDPAAALLDALPGWRRLHADPVAVVHVRTDATAEP